jgi:hypothetical protein
MKSVVRWSAAVLATVLLTPLQPLAQMLPSFQGLWWNYPAGSENGWGLNLTHQGDTLFGTWFTYDADGRGTWLVMPRADRVDAMGMGMDMGMGDMYMYGGYGMTAMYTYTGQLFAPAGPAFDSAAFDGASVVLTPVGSATLSFSTQNFGTFSYTVNGVSGSKAITPLEYARLPMCDFQPAAPGAAPNFEDLWWASPPGAENGWGVNITHQGDILFATWFTYDAQRRPLWLVMSRGEKTGPNTYSGDLYRSRGPAFNAATWSDAHLDKAGSATFAFSDADNGTFTATVDGATRVKAITRLAFASPSTVCH